MRGQRKIRYDTQLSIAAAEGYYILIEVHYDIDWAECASDIVLNLCD